MPWTCPYGHTVVLLILTKAVNVPARCKQTWVAAGKKCLGRGLWWQVVFAEEWKAFVCLCPSYLFGSCSYLIGSSEAALSLSELTDGAMTHLYIKSGSSSLDSGCKGIWSCTPLRELFLWPRKSGLQSQSDWSPAHLQAPTSNKHPPCIKLSSELDGYSDGNPLVLFPSWKSSSTNLSQCQSCPLSSGLWHISQPCKNQSSLISSYLILMFNTN